MTKSMQEWRDELAKKVIAPFIYSREESFKAGFNALAEHVERLEKALEQTAYTKGAAIAALKALPWRQRK